MARERKTVPLERFKVGVNRALTDADRSPEWREGAISALEHALHLANAYHGFRYTDSNAERNAEGYLIPGTYDETRRWYF